MDTTIHGQLTNGTSATWTVGAKIGTGGFGGVYQGTDEYGQPVAIKRLLHFSQSDRANTEAEVQRAMRGRYVVELLGFGEGQFERVGGWDPFLVMPLADRDLRPYVKAARGEGSEVAPLEPDGVLTWVTQITEATAKAHAAGTVHRDLKPGNVLVFGNEVRVSDWGRANLPEHNRYATTQQKLGTYQYMPPEAFLNDKPTGMRGDVYAIGVIAHELLTGTHPNPLTQGEDLLLRSWSHHDNWKGATAWAERMVEEEKIARLSLVLDESWRDILADFCHPIVSHRPYAREAVDRLREMTQRNPSDRHPPTRGEDALAAFEAAILTDPAAIQHPEAQRVRRGLANHESLSVYLASVELGDWLRENGSEPAAISMYMWAFHAFGVDKEIVKRLRAVGFAVPEPPDGARWPPRFNWDGNCTEPGRYAGSGGAN